MKEEEGSEGVRRGKKERKGVKNQAKEEKSRSFSLILITN